VNKKIIFMGTPLVATNYLKVLVEKKYNIVSVITQPPRKKNRGMKIDSSPVQKLANKYNIKVYTPEILDENIFNIIKSIKPDLIIVMAYGSLIPANILNLPLHGFINIHLSLLPRWRGASPIEYALQNDDNKSGVSIIKLTEKLDAGPIIAQNEFLIKKSINKDDLFISLNKIGCKLLIDTLPKLFSGKVDLQNQNEEKATYASKINTEDRKINFKLPCLEVINKIRAYSEKPGAWFLYNNERIKIISAVKKNNKGKPGTILNQNFELGCLDGCISPTFLQREGRNVVKIDDFLRGFHFNVGDILNE
tara:strand:+ start:6218 stop:7138 length:921 start_codon:yes stop_codon:yes gene_type:complete